jgi:hypothetical protein
MRIILRNYKTRQYLQDFGRWTDNPNSAMAFEHSRQAASFAHEKGIKHVEILLAFEDPRYNFRLPLRATG